MTCQWCRINPASEKHHCLIGRDKHNKELDDPRNIGDVCRKCHGKWVGTGGREVREAWWQIKCAEFGEDDMKAWYTNLNLRVKEKYW